MTRIAVISDIHSNITALNATINSIKNNNIDFVYCLGDIIGKGPNPQKCLDICKSFCDKIILGNWEDYFLNTTKINEYPIKYYFDNLNDGAKNFIKEMPYFIEFFISGKLVRMYHASPNNIYKRVYYESDINLHSEMFDIPNESEFANKRTDIAIYGDIHYSFKINYDENFYKLLFKNTDYDNYEKYLFDNYKYINNTKGRMLVNTGSVGQSFDSIFSTYLIIEGELGSLKENDIKIDIIRVPYNNVEEAGIALESTMYDKHLYVCEIITGIFRGYRNFKE